jgi:hypothetical protein
MSPDANNPKTMGFYIDFAPHGKTIIIALVNKCLEVEVPAEVLYEINKKTIFTYWILKNYQQQHSNAVPHEITQLITNALLEVSQYSLTNY